MDSPQYIDQEPKKVQSLADLAKHFVVTKPKGRRELLEEIYSYYDKQLPIGRFCIKVNMALQGSKDSMHDLHFILSTAKDMIRRNQNFSSWLTQYFKN